MHPNTSRCGGLVVRYRKHRASTLKINGVPVGAPWRTEAALRKDRPDRAHPRRSFASHERHWQAAPVATTYASSRWALWHGVSQGVAMSTILRCNKTSVRSCRETIHASDKTITGQSPTFNVQRLCTVDKQLYILPQSSWHFQFTSRREGEGGK
jgi:hypothetical protein